MMQFSASQLQKAFKSQPAGEPTCISGFSTAPAWEYFDTVDGNDSPFKPSEAIINKSFAYSNAKINVYFTIVYGTEIDRWLSVLSEHRGEQCT